MAVRRMRRTAGNNRKRPQAGTRQLAERTDHAYMLTQMGRLDEAEAMLREIVAAAPAFAPASLQLALLYLHAGRRIDTLAVANGGIMHCIDSGPFREIFCRALNGIYIQTRDDTDLEEVADFVKEVSATFARAIEEAWMPVKMLVQSACAFIKLHPSFAWFAGLDERSGQLDSLCEEIISGKAARQALGAPLLNNAMRVDVIPDAELEDILTLLRRCLLALTENGGYERIHDKAVQAFFVHLAVHCFINEYVFAETAEESLSAAQLRETVQSALDDGAPITPAQLLALACYRPLRHLGGAEKLTAMKWPNAFAELIRRQVSEPLEEARLRLTIEPLTEDVVEGSRAVREQYEENPYPRWLRAAADLKALSLDKHLAAMFPHRKFAPPPSGGVQALVAGGGTGSHPIFVARAIADVKVLAVDISTASLAYAMRKTAEMGLENITYRFADINRLRGLSQQFDLIECTGVLHHLEDPMEGWRILAGLLKPGGYMTVGLYSETARKHIVAARNFIAERRFPATPEGIRQCRREIMQAGTGSPLGKLLNDADFYSASGCRDLIFNIQESHFTLPQIETALKELQLDLIGFDQLATEIKADYQHDFPDDPEMTNLANWRAFEQKKPDTFKGMYNIWLHKPL